MFLRVTQSPSSELEHDSTNSLRVCICTYNFEWLGAESC